MGRGGGATRRRDAAALWRRLPQALRGRRRAERARCGGGRRRWDSGGSSRCENRISCPQSNDSATQALVGTSSSSRGADVRQRSHLSAVPRSAASTVRHRGGRIRRRLLQLANSIGRLASKPLWPARRRQGRRPLGAWQRQGWLGWGPSLHARRRGWGRGRGMPPPRHRGGWMADGVGRGGGIRKQNPAMYPPSTSSVLSSQVPAKVRARPDDVVHAPWCQHIQEGQVS